LFGSRLHAGEVEVMLLALERGADLVIMDDNAAKKTAKFLGLRVTGTLGVLLRAKREGVVPSVAGLLDAFVADGLYVTDGLRRLVLEQAGEA
jgi:predicted nucleic acid-binding protein